MRNHERRCGRTECAEKRRSGGRYCGGCFAAANRRSHATHRRERNARRRDRAALRNNWTRASDCARAKLYVAISRGKLKKEPCVKCGSEKVTALILDPARWADVVWICREDRGEELARRLGSEAALGENVAWMKERAAVLAAVASLPNDVRTRLYDIAARGPSGIKLASDAPLFIMRLIRAYRALPTSESTPVSPFACAFIAAEHARQLFFEGFRLYVEAGFQTLARLGNFMFPQSE
jgi:hypothetical protein